MTQLWSEMNPRPSCHQANCVKLNRDPLMDFKSCRCRFGHVSSDQSQALLKLNHQVQLAQINRIPGWNQVQRCVSLAYRPGFLFITDILKRTQHCEVCVFINACYESWTNARLFKALHHNAPSGSKRPGLKRVSLRKRRTLWLEPRIPARNFKTAHNYELIKSK